MRDIPGWYFTLLVVLVLISGTVTGLVVRWMALIPAPDDHGHVVKFQHAIVVSFFTMFGYSLCFFIHHGRLAYLVASKTPLVERIDYPPLTFTWRQCWVYIVSGVLESSYALLIIFGSNMVNASTAVALRVSSVVYSMLLASYVLHQSFQRYQYLGAAVVILGLFIVFLAVMISEPAGT